MSAFSDLLSNVGNTVKNAFFPTPAGGDISQVSPSSVANYLSPQQGYRGYTARDVTYDRNMAAANNQGAVLQKQYNDNLPAFNKAVAYGNSLGGGPGTAMPAIQNNISQNQQQIQNLRNPVPGGYSYSPPAPPQDNTASLGLLAMLLPSLISGLNSSHPVPSPAPAPVNTMPVGNPGVSQGTGFLKQLLPDVYNNLTTMGSAQYG